MIDKELLRKSLLRSITIASTLQESCTDEYRQMVNEDWMRAMMRVYLLAQNA